MGFRVEGSEVLGQGFGSEGLRFGDWGFGVFKFGLSQTSPTLESKSSLKLVF